VRGRRIDKPRRGRDFIDSNSFLVDRYQRYLGAMALEQQTRWRISWLLHGNNIPGCHEDTCYQVERLLSPVRDKHVTGVAVHAAGKTCKLGDRLA
jgi:hypothetical protein